MQGGGDPVAAIDSSCYNEQRQIDVIERQNKQHTKTEYAKLDHDAAREGREH